MSRAYQPRWLACAKDLGVHPGALGGRQFMDWVGARWREWCAANGRDRQRVNEADHAAFDAWLAERATR